MEKDIRWEDFFAQNHRYADIINGIGCKGFQVVREEDLSEATTKIGSKDRDALRKVAFGANFALFGIENQDKLDYKLPIRTMAYDLRRYERQAAEIRRKVREKGMKKESDEYMYGFMKNSKLYPSITFVLYSGIKEWDGARSLHEILDFTGIPKPLQELTSDYRINVIDIRRFEDTTVFQTDVKQVFDFIRCSEDKDRLRELLEKDTSFQNMEEDAIELLSVYTNSKILMLLKEKQNKGGRKDMCKALEDWEAESIAKGKAEGKAEGKQEANQLVAVRLIEDGTLSKEKIAEICQFTMEEMDALMEKACV